MKTMKTRGTRGFTLLEMLVAMTIFAIISVGASFALAGGIRAQVTEARHSADLREARAVASHISDDLRWAMGSTNNLTTLFVASGNTDGDLITMTTLSHRIQSSPTDPTAPNTTLGVVSTQDENAGIPQSNVARVVYHLDMQSHELSRSEVAVPPSQVVPMPDPTPVTLSRRVRSITIEFTGTDGSSRTDWDYESQVQAQQTVTTGSSTTGSASTAAPGTTSVTLGNTDTTLPIAAKVTVDILCDNDQTVELVSSVAISIPTPLPAGQKPSGPALGSLPNAFGGSRGREWRMAEALPGLRGRQGVQL